MAPAIYKSKSPLCRAISIENDVNFKWVGIEALTSLNICESVIIRSGSLFRLDNISSNSLSLTVNAKASWSNISLIICTWGNMRRPFGACISCGATSITLSLGFTISPRIEVFSKSIGALLIMASFSFEIFFLSVELTSTKVISKSLFNKSRLLSYISILFITPITGMFFSFKSWNHSFSWLVLESPAENTSTAKSVFSITSLVFSILRFPNSPSSSNPAVSIITIGPNGSNSIDFDTGSVVVPGVSDTTDIGWLVKALIKLDLPAFLFPNIDICSLFALGVVNIFDLLKLL